jgi:hypothetical protein
MSSSSPNAAPAGAPIRRLALRASRALMLAALLAAALVSFVIVRAQQGSGNEIVSQQGSERLTTQDVSRVVGVARSPAAHGPAHGATCTAGSQGLLRNPWNCTIRYSAGQRISWVIQILPSGHYVGVAQTILDPGKPAQHVAGAITGCCIAVP